MSTLRLKMATWPVVSMLKLSVVFQRLNFLVSCLMCPGSHKEEGFIQSLVYFWRDELRDLCSSVRMLQHRHTDLCQIASYSRHEPPQKCKNISGLWGI